MQETGISIVLAVYNVEPFLEECLESIKKQTFENYEIICIDDGSTDDSLSILKEYEKNDSRIKVYAQENKGPGVARNIGFEYCIGKYVLFMDADDHMEPLMLETLYKEAESNVADLVICNSDEFVTGEDKYQEPWALNFNYIPNKKTVNKSDIGNRLFQFSLGWAWDKLYKSSFIKKYNLKFADLRNSEDLMLVFPSFAVADTIVCVKEVLIHHRINRSNSVSGSRKVDPLAFYRSSLMLKDFLIENDVYKYEVKNAYISWALEYAIWNLNTMVEDEKSYRTIYETLVNEGFSKMDIFDTDIEIFLVPGHFYQMKSMLKYSSSEYRKIQIIWNRKSDSIYYKILWKIHRLKEKFGGKNK